MTTSPRPERWVSLEERSGQFAAEIQATLDGVLPGERTIISTKVEGAERYLVTPDGLNPKARRIPLFVADEYLADLDVALYLSLDRTVSTSKPFGRTSASTPYSTEPHCCGTTTGPT